MPRKTSSKNPADWLWIAETDLSVVRLSVEHEVGFPTCRSKLAEVLEKALKAELIRIGWALEKTHELDHLLDKLIERGSDLVPAAEPLCDALADIYFTDRYPGFDLDDPDWPKLRTQVEGVTALLETIKSRLPAQAMGDVTQIPAAVQQGDPKPADELLPLAGQVQRRLAVCSWSLQPNTPDELVAKLKEIGISRVQLALDPIREKPQVWGNVAEKLRANGFSIVSGMIGFVGEDYATMETIHATGGVAPDETWEENWENVPKAADIASRLGLNLVTFHAGFLPRDDKDPAYTKMHHRLDLIADLFAAKNIDVAFETGQETAAVLLDFLKKLGRTNVGVNFDPANMILYDKGDPIEALRDLGAWLKQVHIKDGTRTKVPGTWGEEVVAGTGDVPWGEFFTTLQQLRFTGYCCIEREAGNSRVEDIQAAKRMVERIGV